jgi:hypothetical protein
VDGVDVVDTQPLSLSTQSTVSTPATKIRVEIPSVTSSSLLAVFRSGLSQVMALVRPRGT